MWGVKFICSSVKVTDFLIFCFFHSHVVNSNSQNRLLVLSLSHCRTAPSECEALICTLWFICIGLLFQLHSDLFLLLIKTIMRSEFINALHLLSIIAITGTVAVPPTLSSSNKAGCSFITATVFGRESLWERTNWRKWIKRKRKSLIKHSKSYQ